MAYCNRSTLSLALVVVVCVFLPLHGVHADNDISNNYEPPPRDVYAGYNSGLAAAYKTANFFLGKMVQSKYLTTMESKVDFSSWKAIGDSFKDDGWRDWVVYLIGFAICAAVGIVLLLVMIFFALIFPCCRCCGNCGGKPDMRDGKKSGCARTGCAVALLVICACIILGVIPMYAASKQIENSLVGDESMFDVVGDSILGTEAYLNSAITSMDEEAYQDFHNTTRRVMNDMLELPQDGMEALNNETQVLTAFNILYSFTNELTPLNTSLTVVTENTTELNTLSNDLTTELDTIKTDTLATLASCGGTCNATIDAVNDLQNVANYSSVDVMMANLAVSYAIQANLSGMVTNIEKELTKIMSDINATTYAAVEEANKEITKVDEEMKDTLDQLEKIVSDIEFSRLANDVKDIKTKTYMTRASYGLKVGMYALASIVLLIVVCQIIGILFGSLCPRPDSDEGVCACSRNQGSRWLMAGVGVALVFYWLLTIVLMVFFFTGGPAYTEVCRHTLHYYEPKSTAVLDLLDKTINGSIQCSAGSTCFEYDLLPFDAYARCERDVSLYSALNLETQGLNISEILDPAKIKPYIDDIKGLKVTLPPVDLITPELNATLMQLDAAMALDYLSMHFQLTQEPIDSAKLQTAITSLEALNDTVPGITTHVDALKALTTSHLTPMSSLANSAINQLIYIEKASDVDFASMAKILSDTEVFLNVSGDVFVSGFINTTADGVFHEIVLLSGRVIQAVESDIGRCGELHTSLWKIFHATCADMVFPINAFAFSLGWCIFFLIPSLILSLKLVTLYRKTDKYYEDTEFDYVGNHNPPVEAYDHNPDLNNPLLHTGSQHGLAPIPAIDNPVFNPNEGQKEALTLPRPHIYPDLDMISNSQTGKQNNHKSSTSVPGYYYPGPPPDYNHV